jgi:hypothetical protein
MSWREALAWLRGYSDALAGKDEDTTIWPDYVDAYKRGHVSGSQ